MKRFLCLALSAFLLAPGALAQATPTDSGIGINRGAVQRQNPPVTNPEPLTLAALAGGAAVAGGLLRRRKK